MLGVLLILAAVVGDSAGYTIGWHRGAKTVVIARVVPIIRTFAPVVAGIGQMEYRRFVFYNIAGGVAWVTSMTWGGYLLGQAVPNIGDRIHLVLGIVLFSLTPIVVELARERRRRSA